MMKWLSCCAALALALWGATGCSEDPNAPPVGPDITGEWSGVYQDPGGPAIPISATIQQNGSSIFVETSMPEIGRLLTGTMNEKGHAFLEDSFNGDTWSTVAGTVTPNSVDFIDYAYGPGTALRHITLHR